MSKESVIEVRENAKKMKNEYFVGKFNITKSIELLLKEIEKDYEFKKQVELQFGCHTSNERLNKLAEKYGKQLADLEAKLAESEKDSKARYSAWQEEIGECDRLRVVLAEVRKQLAEEKEFTEQYKKECAKIQTDYYQLKQQLAEKEKEIDEMNKAWVQSVHDWKALCKKKDQDKISFAVEQLKETKIYADNQGFMARYKSEGKAYASVWNYIDNQIKQLKEGK